MRTAGLVVLSGLLLAGCDQGPTFDASSLPAYQKSLSEIHAQLGADDRRRLDAALVMIAGGNSVDVTQLSSGGRVVVLPALDGVAGPLIYLDRLRPVINGKSAAKVIKTVADGLDYEIGRAEKQRADAKAQLGAIEIANPRYYWNRGKYADQPEIAFSVFNGGKVAISGIVLRGTLTLRGRTVATGGANYNFARVLQPGERQSAKVVPNAGLASKDMENLFDADFALQVANLEDTNGRRLLLTDVTVLETMKKNRDALRGG